MVAAVAAVTWMGGQTMDRPLTDETSLQAVAPTVTTDPVLAQKEETKTEKLVLQDPASIRIKRLYVCTRRVYCNPWSVSLHADSCSPPIR